MKPPRLLCIALLVATAPAVEAQVTPIKGTGCPNMNATIVFPAPKIGKTTNITHQLPCNSPGAFGFVLLGPAPIRLPLRCAQTCVIGVLPTWAFFRSISVSVPLAIPNDVKLVGVCLYAQAGCLFTIPAPPCVGIVHQAVKICIQR